MVEKLDHHDQDLDSRSNNHRESWDDVYVRVSLPGTPKVKIFTIRTVVPG